MSRYLVRRLEANPAISLRTHTELVALEGNGHLEHVTWRDATTGDGGATRHSPRIHHGRRAAGDGLAGWLRPSTDDKGFLKTGGDLSPDDLAARRWPLARSPHSLETSLPGVFAVGDVRSGSMKRVASAVGEGAAAVALVHRVLREQGVVGVSDLSRYRASSRRMRSTMRPITCSCCRRCASAARASGKVAAIGT